MPTPWTRKRANDWYAGHPWLVGCNYAPRTAINQLEMWQGDTFDPATINQELKWAASLGFNTVRIFLHDLLWQQEEKKFLARIDKVLGIAQKHGIRVMLVFFDSVWHPFPSLGKQREPEPGVHNSGWVQSPGLTVLRDEARFNALESYVTGVIDRFKDDPRVLIWDVWNEPDNPNSLSYGPRDLGLGKEQLVANLLPRVFDWARAAKPTQPLTCGIWLGDWSSDETFKPHEKLQVELSDVISFHNYGNADDTERRIEQLRRYKRPLLCTEYMSRGTGSTFETVLPVLKKYNVGAYNWGFVAGRTQTNYPWDSWQRPYVEEPDPWFHEIFHPDGRPYRQAEIDCITALTERGPKPRPKTSAKPKAGTNAKAAKRRR
ncbi:MAG TPA: cellulase family glycosylhydrolase [Tepidisphaeraceae bacterium]